MKILVFPRDDATPYQRLLYGEMQGLGVQIRYAGRMTASHTCNLLLLPVELVVWRMAGIRLVHLHWVFAFSFPGAGNSRILRWLAQVWFVVCLGTIKLLGMRLVWTAHNVLPHAPVFADDVAARRTLVAISDLVIAHSHMTLRELAALGAVPRAYAIVPHGPLLPDVTNAPLRVPGTGEAPRQLLFFGRVEPYKGVEDLLQAFMSLGDGICAHLTVAGKCHEPGLRRRLNALTQESEREVNLRLEHVPEKEVTQLLSSADAVILPFRQVTTSGSVMLALSHGRPLVIPDLAALAHLPEEAVVRYDGSVGGLTAALEQVICADNTSMASMSVAASAYAATTTWHEIAARTVSEMALLLRGVPQAELQSRMFAPP